MKKFKLLDFYADWCGPCKTMKPIIEKIKNEMEDVEVEFINVDQNPDLAAYFGVMSIPTLALLKDDQLIDQRSGVASYEVLVDWINDFKEELYGG